MASGRKRRKAEEQKPAQATRSEGTNPEDCPVCLTPFDDTQHRPRTLPCGHSFCTACIDELKEQGVVVCPTCRAGHTVPEAGGFPVSYVLEAVIKKLKDAEVARAATRPSKRWKGENTAARLRQRGTVGVSSKIRSLLEGQEAQVRAAISTCQQLQSQLDQYQTTLADWGNQQQHLEDKLQRVIDQSKSARVLMQQEEARAVAKKQEVMEAEQQLHTVLQTVCGVTTPNELYTANDTADDCTEEVQQREKECWETFPDKDTMAMAKKVREVSSAALEAVQIAEEALGTVGAAAGAAQQLSLLPDLSSTITDRWQALMLSVTLKAEDLRSMKPPVRSLLEACRVFAVHEVEGQKKYSKISFTDGQLLLHSLQSQPPPPGAATLQVSDVVPSCPPCVVFLDLVWPGSAPKRVLIRLCPDTPLGRQFVLLCTGQRGPSYANTKLFRVENKGEPDECVCGGDYERNDGEGGAALLPDINEGDYWRSCRAGAVRGWWWWWGDPNQHSAQFSITTRDMPGSKVFPGVFGEVVEGLAAVAAAAKHRDIKEVTVMDCGVVLWR